MKTLFRFLPILFIFFIWFIFAKPYFLDNKVPFASTYLTSFFPPWASYQTYKGPVKNNAAPDVMTQIYPWKKLSVDIWKTGNLPLWNPYSFSGTPLLADYQSSVLSPFNLLYFILPFLDAWSFIVLSQFLLAGIFMFLFMRSLNISKEGSLISAVSFMFCGFITVWGVYGTLAFAILFLPLSLFAVEKFYQTKKNIYLFLLTLSIPFSFFSGHFQISLYFLLFVLSYSLFKYLKEKKQKLFLLNVSSIILGLIISLLQLLPSIQLYFMSVRSSFFAKIEVIPWSYLPTLLAPDFFGNPVTRNDWFGHYAEWNGYLGVIPLFLGFYAFRRFNPYIKFFALFSLIPFLLAFQTPILDLLINLKIPVLSTSAVSRIIVLFSFSFAVLAGFGFGFLREDLEKKKYKFQYSLTAVFSLLFIFLWLTSFRHIFLPQDKSLIALSNLKLPSVIFLFFAFSILLIRFVPKRSKFLFPLLIIPLVSFDLLRFTIKWQPFDPRNLVYPQTKVVNAILKNIGYGRIFGNLGGEVTTYYKIPSIEGYDALYIARYGEFIRSANNGKFEEGERSLVRISRRGEFADRALNLLGVNLIFHPVADTNQGWAYPVWEKNMRQIYNDGVFSLYKNQNALPRASLFYNFVVLKDKKKIIERFYSDKFDYRNTLILEEKPSFESGIGNQKSGIGSAEIISYTPNLVQIKTQTNSPALLFVSDNYYLGWKAYINGKETRIYRADYTFRAITVPKGESEVIFKFEPIL